MEIVKITEEGWEIREEDKILFDRYNHQKEQCLPRKNGDIQKILKYINIKNQKNPGFCVGLSAALYQTSYIAQ